jgi:hypothetical protein
VFREPLANNRLFRLSGVVPQYYEIGKSFDVTVYPNLIHPNDVSEECVAVGETTSGLHPSSGILKTRKHNVSIAAFVSILR